MLYQNFSKKYFDPGWSLKVLFLTTKIFSKTHYHTHFYGNSHFFPPYHTPKKREHKKIHFFIFISLSTTGGKAKNRFEQKVSLQFFIKKCRRFYYLTFIQKISRKLNFSFFNEKYSFLLPSITILSIPSSKNKKCYHFFLP